MSGSLNFPLSEAARASDVQLGPQDVERWNIFANAYLQPMRDGFKFPICVTSFVRRRSGDRGSAHYSAAAVDFQPCEVVDGVVLSAWEFDRRLEMLYEFQKRHSIYGELIHERDHVHLTLPGFGGNQQTLREPVEGTFVPDGVDYVLDPLYASVERGSGFPIEYDARAAVAGLIALLLFLYGVRKENK